MTFQVELWCDGSGTVEGEPAGWAYVLLCTHPVTGESKVVEGSGGMPTGTNNRAEMTALIMGLRALKRPCRVEVHSDSKYVLEPLRLGWTEGWERKQFIKAGEERKNADLWRLMLVEVRRHVEVTYVHVKGHSGVEWNERCDVLAGAERRQLLEHRVVD